MSFWSGFTSFFKGLQESLRMRASFTPIPIQRLPTYYGVGGMGSGYTPTVQPPVAPPQTPPVNSTDDIDAMDSRIQQLQGQRDALAQMLTAEQTPHYDDSGALIVTSASTLQADQSRLAALDDKISGLKMMESSWRTKMLTPPAGLSGSERDAFFDKQIAQVQASKTAAQTQVNQLQDSSRPSLLTSDEKSQRISDAQGRIAKADTWISTLSDAKQAGQVRTADPVGVPRVFIA